MGSDAHCRPDGGERHLQLNELHGGFAELGSADVCVGQQAVRARIDDDQVFAGRVKCDRRRAAARTRRHHDVRYVYPAVSKVCEDLPADIIAADSADH
jgi:hypothetical protein